MNIIIFGSTGANGIELVKLALEQGHNVTAFARNPNALPVRNDRLATVRGDILDISSVESAIAGKDVVFSTLGVRKLRRNTILSDGTRNIIAAMQKQGVRRFICETSLDVGDSRGQLGLVFNWFIRGTFLRNAFADKEIQERYIMESSLDWIIARPTMLTNGPRTGTYQVWVGKKPASTRNRISRADVADFMLKQMMDNTYLKKAPGLSY